MNLVDPANLGKVGVIYGGGSAEREISLRSGRAVLDALLVSGVQAVGVDVTFDAGLTAQLSGFDRVFIALHGRGGEDGTIQAVLNLLQIPYTGSGVLASALAMDKLRCKQLWHGCGLPSPRFAAVVHQAELESAWKHLGGPLMVKPPHEGSSIGMSRVTSFVELQDAFTKARAHDSVVLLEQWVEGPEFTCAILDDQALPVIRLETPNAFYDYEAKYQSTQTRYICPCGLDATAENRLKALALEAFDALDCRGWGRVDIMQDRNGQNWLLEVNTVPGMTDHSLVPMAARAQGMTFAELVLSILAGAGVEN